MWEADNETISERVHRYRPTRDGERLSYRQVLQLWTSDATFQSFFSELLMQSSFPAYRWETPAVTTETVEQPFEFVLIRSDGLERPARSQAFEDYFDNSFVVTFPNRSGDAMMIVPCPQGEHSAYTHMAAFMRAASEEQTRALWNAVATAMQQRIGARPIWLNTAGMGVAWLHIRLDSHPKYYNHAPYKPARVQIDSENQAT